MRAAIWLLGLFGVAVAVALFAGNNDAIVTFFWPPYRVDLSLNFFLLALALSFAILYLAIRAVFLLLALPRQARSWRDLKKERAINTELISAQFNYLAGRYIRAKKAADLAINLDQSRRITKLSTAKSTEDKSQLRAMAHVLFAQSAHALQDISSRDEHLNSALSEASTLEMRDGIYMLGATFSLDDRDATSALNQLSQLSNGAARRTSALRIKLKTVQVDNLTNEALATTRLLAKHHAISKDVAIGMVKSLILKQIQETQNIAQLQMTMQVLDKSERDQLDISINAAFKLYIFGGDFQQVGDWLLPAWQSVISNMRGFVELDNMRRLELIETIEYLVSMQELVWLAHVENAQRANPREANLLYLAGMACKANKLWGKAQQQLMQAEPLLNDDRLKRKALCALAELAEQRDDKLAAETAWKKAAQLSL